MNKRGLIFMIALSLCACNVGPDYVRPPVIVPLQYKEAPQGWKTATPQDTCNRGAWWEIFNDPELNVLESQVLVNNQNVAVAFAQYQQAIATISQARAGLFPTVTGSVSVTREKRSTAGINPNQQIGNISVG